VFESRRARHSFKHLRTINMLAFAECSGYCSGWPSSPTVCSARPVAIASPAATCVLSSANFFL
jgi:hypothetical protein